MKKIMTITLLMSTITAYASNYTAIFPFENNYVSFVKPISPPTVETGIEGSIILSKYSLNRGDSASISWNYDDIDFIQIDGIGTYNQSSGSVNIQPLTSMNYSVSIHKGEKVKQENLSINVIQPIPQISLTATSYNIGFGNSSIISWSVTNSDDVSISHVGSNLAKSDSYSVSPTTDTTYTLTAKGYENVPEKTSSITIKVSPDAVINSFDVNKTTFNKSETAIFTWNVENASKVTLNGVVINADLTTTSVTLNTVGTVSYELEVTGLNGHKTKQTKTLTVNEASIISLFNVNGGESSIVTSVSTLITFTWDMVTPKNLKITNDRGFSNNLSVSAKKYTYTFNHPIGDTVYTLEATNDSGEKFTKQVTVTSVAPAIINTVTAMSSIYVGESYTLDWTGTGIIRYTLRSDDEGTGIPLTDTEFTSGQSFVVPKAAQASGTINIYLMGYSAAGTTVQKSIRYKAVETTKINTPLINNVRNLITVAPNAAISITAGYGMTVDDKLVGRDSTNSYDVTLPKNAPSTPGVYEYYIAAYKTVNGITRYSNLLTATVTVK